MTTFELATHLARRLKGGSLPALSAGATMDLVEAINVGLQECYERLPSWQRRVELSLPLAAPTTVSVGVTNGSATLASGTFSAAQIGRSVVLAGDSNWNKVASTTTLLDAYQGTTGTVAGTVYGDVVSNSLANLDGFSGPLRFADTREELLPHNVRRLEPYRSGEVGKPRYYWSEPAGASLGNSPTSHLRVYPAPDVAYVLRCDAEFRPSLVTFTTLHQAATIPLADQFLHAALLPLCEACLLRSPEWADDAKSRLVLDAAERGRALLLGQRPSAGFQPNRIFTPPGY